MRRPLWGDVGLFVDEAIIGSFILRRGFRGKHGDCLPVSITGEEQGGRFGNSGSQSEREVLQGLGVANYSI